MGKIDLNFVPRQAVWEKKKFQSAENESHAGRVAPHRMSGKCRCGTLNAITRVCQRAVPSVSGIRCWNS